MTTTRICAPNSGMECTNVSDTFLEVRFAGSSDKPERMTRFSVYDYTQQLSSYRAAKSRAGDKYISKLQGQKDALDWVSGLTCPVAGALCTGALTIALGANPASLILAGSVCTGGVYACKIWVSHRQEEIQRTIDLIKAACAEGDRECYEAVIKDSPLGQEVDAAANSPGATSDDSRGGSGTGSSGNTNPGPGTAAPIEVPHQGTVTVTEPKDGTPGGGTPCNKVPKPKGCENRPPAKEK